MMKPEQFEAIEKNGTGTEKALLRELQLSLTMHEITIRQNKLLEAELKLAVKFLAEGKRKFTPNTTNSFVDDFLEKHKDKL